MKKILLLLCFIYIPVYGASLKEKIISECVHYTDEEVIENKAPKCKKAIGAYLQKVIDNKIPRFDQGLYSFLSLALRSDMPLAYKFIEKEIYEGHLNDWIDKLEELNFDLYGKSIKNWARHVESEVRKNYKIEQNKKEDYSASMTDDKRQVAPELMSVWSPILMEKYLDFLALPKQRVEIEDLSTINIIYAFSTASFRDVFSDQISKVILKASDLWVKSIRKEQIWVLFRLFPLVPKTADGNIKRELIWLEKYHSDFRIRSLATATIAKLDHTKPLTPKN